MAKTERRPETDRSRQPPRLRRTGSSKLRDRLKLAAVGRPKQLFAPLGELERFFRGTSRARREL
ncbi:MAG TPA: hypothetical protein VGK07_06020 [Candidatus Limnocylindria bacterium]